MDDEHRDPAFDAIERLIREEEGAALEAFRRRDFGRRVAARIEAAGGLKTGRSFPRPAFLAAAAVLLMIAAGAYFFLHRSGPRGAGRDAGRFVAVFRELPGLAELASRPAAPPRGETEILPAAASIRDGLAMAGRQKAGEEESAPLPKAAPNVPRLSLEKKMAILFKDKAIERVLVSIREKTKEV